MCRNPRRSLVELPAGDHDVFGVDAALRHNVAFVHHAGVYSPTYGDRIRVGAVDESSFQKCFLQFLLRPLEGRRRRFEKIGQLVEQQTQNYCRIGVQVRHLRNDRIQRPLSHTTTV